MLTVGLSGSNDTVEVSRAIGLDPESVLAQALGAKTGVTTHLFDFTSFIINDLAMEKPVLQRIAPLASTAIISFLAYPSQYLFYYIEPGPLRKGDAYIFNILVASVLFCYYRACYADPGRIPADWQDRVQLNGSASDAARLPLQQRWCRKCEMYKPPRAHHCKTCRR